MSRFTGGLLGSAIAAEYPHIFPLFAPWEMIQDCAIATLLQTGKLATQDWLKQIEKRDICLLEKQKTATSSEVAAMILPLILFFHDLPNHLKIELTRTASLWLHPEESLAEILLWGEAIALILREQANMTQFLPDLATHHPPCADILNLMQESRDRRLSLKQTVNMLSDRRPGAKEIALALYCFSFTPEDLPLCLHRALQLTQQAPLTAILTGAIAGVYNSSISVPSSWCLSASRQQTLQQGKLFFSAWSGCYSPNFGDRLVDNAIGGAGTLQPRKGFTTISQRESTSRSL
ncbi:ADP-ribosylglycohydrolase family protein [Spirulina sp. 06S082]|nr:ADP-ribosylglycohydrolase family protein [Spirulina sp. 06S082]